MSIEAGESELRQFLAGLDGDRNFIQGAGGNVSVKHDGQMLIKASGLSMAQAFHPDLFCGVAIDTDGGVSLSLGGCERAARPSIETPVHAVLPHRFVVHFHAVSVMPWLVCHDAEKHISGRFSGSMKFVDYAKPGEALAREIENCIGRDSVSPLTIFLQNHGIVVAAETMEQVQGELNRLPKSDICRDLEPCQTLVEDDFFDLAPSIFENVPIVSKEEIEVLLQSWAICPDHVVFLGPQLLKNVEVENLNDTHSDSNPLRGVKIFWDDAKGFFVRKGVSASERDQIQFYFDVISRVENFNEINALSAAQVSELLSWEAEHFRQQLSQSQI